MCWDFALDEHESKEGEQEQDTGLCPGATGNILAMQRRTRGGEGEAPAHHPTFMGQKKLLHSGQEALGTLHHFQVPGKPSYHPEQPTPKQ